MESTTNHKADPVVTTLARLAAELTYTLEAIDLSNHYRGPWGEHPHHEVGDWAEEVASESTRLGYWEWVANRINSGGFNLDDDS
jgi:hypothetical protein